MARPLDTPVHLDPREVLELQNGKGLEVRCLGGNVWIMQAGDHEDIVLHGGETFVLDRQGLNASQQRTVATMRDSAQALLRIIDDVLDFSKIEAGRLELEAAPFSPPVDRPISRFRAVSVIPPASWPTR